MRASIKYVCMTAALGAIGQAHAQSNEDRLRDALRQSVTQMRAAEDQAAQSAADLQKAQQDRAAVQAQLDAALAKLAQAAPATSASDLARLTETLAATRQQAAGLQAALAKYQSAYQQLAAKAQAQDTQDQMLSRGLQGQTHALDSCKAENTQLVGVAEDILHLYLTQDFRSLVLRSYEPFVGSAKVKLENLVQDYDDKIRAQEYVAAAVKVKKQGSKVFFFEKEKQKTFTSLGWGFPERFWPKQSKVFCFSFSKKKSLLPYFVAAALTGPQTDQSCVDVAVGSAQSYECINQQLAAQQHRAAAPDAPATATSPANVTGQFDEAATRNRLGRNFGHSVTPERPAYAPPRAPR